MKTESLPTVRPASDSAADDWLSALADGQGGAAAVERACRDWRDDAPARQTWHAYHLIGDVLRSDELAAPRGRDAAFLDALRQRMAAEPVVLAPAPAARRRQPWLVPAAMAAGFAAVAGVLVIARTGPAAGIAPAAEVAAASSPAVLAAVAAPMLRVGTAGASRLGGDRMTLVNDSGLLRDARLDEFLRAHQAVGTGMTMAVPGGTLRRVDLLTPADNAR